MRILIVTPAAPGSRKGNRITATRWARLLRQLDARVQISEQFAGQPADLLLALHARKSADSIARFSQAHPERPIVLALTGTDLYGDIHTSRAAQRSLDLATRLVLLQSHGLGQLSAELQGKARVILQSAETPRSRPRPLRRWFEVSVIGHLRSVKDPFRTALAARKLPAASRVRVVQMGAALSPEMADRANREMQRNDRYHWLGELPRWKTLQRLARSRLLVLTSRLEGGANVISESLAADTPVLSTRISGSLGLLGEDYPGYFPVGDTAALAELLTRCETDAPFYKGLQRACRARRRLFLPDVERAAWKRLLRDLKREAG